MRSSIFLFVLCFAVGANALSDAFNEAQVAAAENRYADVVSILTTALERDEMDAQEQAIAFGNRGIAYSLLHDYEAAVTDLRQAIALDPEHQLSLNHLGILAEHVYKQFEAAAGWYERGAALGYPASSVNLGNLFREGRGVRRDPAQAARLYQQALDQGYSTALVSLGALYLNGDGVVRDYAKALDLLKRGTAEGVVAGNFYLGRAYELGLGVDRDLALAHQHYRLAADAGFAPAQGALGYLYRRGLGVEKDLITAVSWYRRAADQGDSTSANRLAWLLATCPLEEICDGKAALVFARLAVDAERSATNLDTLAAAFARVGEFDRATEIVREILARETLGDSARGKFAGRIDRYENGIPFQL